YGNKQYNRAYAALLAAWRIHEHFGIAGALGDTALKLGKYREAAEKLVAEGKVKKGDFPWDTDGFKAPQSGFIDGIIYDGRKPNAYLKKFKIGHK
ncbi:MAG: hypothetical protein ACRBBN_21125, partial [Methyloligellaceae bacterium]